MFKSAWLLSGISAFGLLAGTAMAQDAKPMPSPAPAPAPTTAAPVVIGCCNSSCCTSGCTTGCFDNSGESQCGQWHPLADVEFMILTPFWNNNPAMFVGNASTGTTNTDVKDFGQPDQFVPVIHLGFINDNGWGARVGWWGFATSKTESLNNAGLGGDGGITSASPLGLEVQKFGDDPVENVSSAYTLSMDVWDLEAVKSITSGNLSLLISGGFRYAHIGMNYDSAEFFGAGPDTGSPHHFLISGNNFNGAGLTSALEGHWGRTVYLDAMVRGSLLFGAGSQHATDGSTFEPTAIFDNVQSNYNEVVPVVETQIGIGIKGNENRAIVPFFEVGVNLQAWFDVGNPSRSSTSVVGTDTNFGPSYLGSTAAESTLGLFGVYIRGGLTF